MIAPDLAFEDGFRFWAYGDNHDRFFRPVSDNAQSIYELSQNPADIRQEIEKVRVRPDFKKAKHSLEANDGAGNTFKALKPVLIGTAVVER